MIYEKIMSVHNALGVLADKVDKEVWAFIRLARRELMDAADQAQEMEERFIVVSADRKREVSHESRRMVGDEHVSMP